jgi:DNA excision repair protein ERCC-4
MADLQPEQLTAIIDNREQTPLDLAPLQTVRGTLQTGDYSVSGLEHVIAVERKSLPDLVQSCGRERSRFSEELERLMAYPVRAIVVEATWRDLEAGGWRGSMTPAAVKGSVMGFIAMGIPVCLVGNHAAAGAFVSRLLYIAARRRWRELQAFQTLVNQARGKAG